MSEPSPPAQAPPPPRSLRRSFAALVLVAEVLVVGFAALVARVLVDVPGPTLAALAGGTAGLCLLAAATLRSRAGYLVGSAVPVLLILSAVRVPMMAVVGLLFGGLWLAALVLGGRADAQVARRRA
jgi:Protein of unknown function (DUF4233)